MMPQNLANNWQANVINAVENGHLLAQQCIDIVNETNQFVVNHNHQLDDIVYYDKLTNRVMPLLKHKITMWKLVLPTNQATHWDSVVEAIYDPKDDTIPFDDSVGNLVYYIVTHGKQNCHIMLNNYNTSKVPNYRINDFIDWLTFLETSLVDLAHQ